MKHELLFLGRTKYKYIDDGVQNYLRRLHHYTSLHVTTLKQKLWSSTPAEPSFHRRILLNT